MEYKVDFYEDAVSCVDSATFKVSNEKDLFDQCEKYVNEVLLPMGIEVCGSKHFLIKA